MKLGAWYVYYAAAGGPGRPLRRQLVQDIHGVCVQGVGQPNGEQRGEQRGATVRKVLSQGEGRPDHGVAWIAEGGGIRRRGAGARRPAAPACP